MEKEIKLIIGKVHSLREWVWFQVKVLVIFCNLIHAIAIQECYNNMNVQAV